MTVQNDNMSARLGLLVIVLAWVAFCWPWLVAGKVIPFDAKNHFYPMIRFVAAAWHAGESAAWSPYLFAGFPMISDPQSTLWTPTLLLPALLDARPSMWLVDVIHAAHLLVGALAVFAFARLRGWYIPAAVAAALTYMMGGSASIRLEHFLMTVSYMWLAIALWRLEATIQHGELWRGLSFAVPLTMMLIDRNHVAYLGVWFLFLWWLVRVYQQIDGRIGPGSTFGAVLRRNYPVVVGGGLAITLALVPILLAAQLAANSNRPAFGLEEASWQSLHPAALLTFALPEIFGALLSSEKGWPVGNYWGPASQIWGGANLKMHRGMLHIYSGVFPVVLILWSGITGRRILGDGAHFFAIAAIISLFYALGRHTPVFEILYNVVPGVDLFRRPADGTFIFGFSISLLTGALLHRALAPQGVVEPTKVMQWLVGGVFAAVMFTALVLAISHGKLWDFAISMLVFAVLSLSIISLLHPRLHLTLGRTTRIFGLMLIMTTDLVYFTSNLNNNARPATAYRPLETSENSPLFAKIADLLKTRDPVGAPWRIETIGLGPTVQNIGQAAGFSNVLGYNALRLRVVEEKIAPRMQNNASSLRNFGTDLTGYSSEAANALGLRYIITGAPLSEIDPTAITADFPLITTFKRRKKTTYIYRNNKALPRASLLSTTNVPLDGTIRVTRYAPTDILLEVTSPHDAVLILREFNYPGWTATVNGQRVTIEQHQELFRQVDVPAGESAVRFQFHPLGFENLLSTAREVLNGPAQHN